MLDWDPHIKNAAGSESALRKTGALDKITGVLVPSIFAQLK